MTISENTLKFKVTVRRITCSRDGDPDQGHSVALRSIDVACSLAPPGSRNS